ncbi:OLC1v1029155C1 [Oldenlandia corymbosa var. corymbosa]|uniref:OLC1v1029155C1 n=1 Tax=Oldenlandia corymbosa var. corymbosa TaxID=529605 RepID=A0AAV1CG85_OLDCO|nr:OLC1v1029155C1 [Oldenlandia corymbosa var. corymbosa]
MLPDVKVDNTGGMPFKLCYPDSSIWTEYPCRVVSTLLCGKTCDTGLINSYDFAEATRVSIPRNPAIFPQRGRRMWNYLRQNAYHVTWKPSNETRYLMLIKLDASYLIDEHFNFRKVAGSQHRLYLFDDAEERIWREDLTVGFQACLSVIIVNPLDVVKQTHTPLPPDPGGEILENEALPSVPIHVVTQASQLPAEFLEPSPQGKLVIGFDCEGVDLCRHGTLCIMQLAFPDAIYLVDAIEGGEALVKACKPALESDHITKVIHDCKRDSEALYFQFGIKLHNVVDTQIAYSLIKEQEGQTRAPDDYISFVGLLADPTYCGISYAEKEEVRVLLRQDPKFWTYRPLSDQMIRAAADDVRFLLSIYNRMVEKLNERSLWYLSVRGALYCRCFCTNDNHYADWPPLPPVPEHLLSEDNTPEEEVLSVLDVPPGKMGRVIGKRGATILYIKESCNAEIFIGGAKGPPDKVFIIGPVKQVRKAEAMLRGRMLDIY